MLESLKEYFSSTINTAAQRVSNPVFGAFSLSWCAFNWKSILYLFLSDSGIIDKITYISDNSTWKTVALYPCLSVALLCGCLPWINNFISAWQSRPLDNNDSIENHRKAKRIARATRLQRLQAKHDVTYDKVKTGAEKDIQGMKEQITESQARMGELTAQKELLMQQHGKMLEKIKELQKANDTIKKESDTVKQNLMERHAYTSELEIKLAEQNEYIANLNDQIKQQHKPSSLTARAIGTNNRRS